MKIIIFVQARMSSKRLPGKVLLKLDNKTILEHISINLSKSKFTKKLIILTSNHRSDNKIANLCKRKKIDFYRGDLKNVYKRYVDALIKYRCDGFVRICADSPLINAELVDNAIQKFKSKKFDIVTNCFPKSYPKGLSVEVVNTDIFLNNFKNIKKKSFSEHITKYFYSNYKNFRIFNIKSRKKKKYASLAIDNIKDYEFLKKEFNFI